MLPKINEKWHSSNYRVREAKQRDAKKIEEWVEKERDIHSVESFVIDAIENVALDLKNVIIGGYYILEKMEVKDRKSIGIFEMREGNYEVAYLVKDQRKTGESHGEPGLGSKCTAVLIENQFINNKIERITVGRRSIEGREMLIRIGFTEKELQNVIEIVKGSVYDGIDMRPGITTLVMAREKWLARRKEVMKWF